jgi:hypothetical protein
MTEDDEVNDENLDPNKNSSHNDDDDKVSDINESTHASENNDRTNGFTSKFQAQPCTNFHCHFTYCCPSVQDRIAEVQLINEAGNVMESKDGDTGQFLKVEFVG